MIFRTIFNAFQLGYIKILGFTSSICTRAIFRLVGIHYGSLTASGIPFIHVSLDSHFSIGNNFVTGNSILTAGSGEKGRCKFDVRRNAELIIGDNVGITMSSIKCRNKITIGNDVKIGYGTIIIDNDGHSLDADTRCSKDNNVCTKPIFIGDKAFIGAHCFILKGVTIGEGSIIGACSVVTKDVPAYCVVAGNPAKVVKYLISDSR